MRPIRGLSLLLLVAGAGVMLGGCDQHAGKPRQQQTVKLLPDTPPPPPPPKQDEKKPEPQKEDKPQQQLDKPRPVEAPQQQQALKTNEAPGDGAGGALQSGSVTQDYRGGAVVQAASAAGAAQAVDRARERLYANSVRPLLRDEIEKRLSRDAGQLTATFAIWVAADGHLQRWEVQPSGQVDADRYLRGALDEASRQMRLPPPDGVPQPMRFRLTVQPQG
jgi:hypothetical protein